MSTTFPRIANSLNSLNIFPPVFLFTWFIQVRK
jgi:hypothetical protein